MKEIKSKLDLLLKAVIVLAMIGSLAGCSGGSPGTFTIPTPPPPTISPSVSST